MISKWHLQERIDFSSLEADHQAQYQYLLVELLMQHTSKII
jgi:hypothetical protein